MQRNKLSLDEWRIQYEARHPPVAPFQCAICQREIADQFYRDGRDRHLEPICRYCEGAYSDRAPNAGAFMDRRMAARLSAIANALGSNAYCMKWEAEHGRP